MTMTEEKVFELLNKVEKEDPAKFLDIYSKLERNENERRIPKATVCASVIGAIALIITGVVTIYFQFFYKSHPKEIIYQLSDSDAVRIEKNIKEIENLKKQQNVIYLQQVRDSQRILQIWTLLEMQHYERKKP